MAIGGRIVSGRAIAMVVMLCCLAAGCASTPRSMKSLVKSDIDMVNEVHYRTAQQLLKSLTRKLYLRNPVQLARGKGVSIENRQDLLFASPKPVNFAELDNRQGIAAMQLAFDSDFSGDRVFAMMAGLVDMINQSYGYRSEFYLLDEELDEVQLYKSAHNIEVLVWMLAKRRDEQGKPYLLTNSISDTGVENLSFERLLGKLIATQETLASIAAEKNQRLIKSILHNAASMVFIPL